MKNVKHFYQSYEKLDLNKEYSSQLLYSVSFTAIKPSLNTQYMVQEKASERCP